MHANPTKESRERSPARSPSGALEGALAGSIAIWAATRCGARSRQRATGEGRPRNSRSGGKEQGLTGWAPPREAPRELAVASSIRIRRPLAQATTASLEALRSYTLALDEGRVIIRLASIPHLRRAIELDPDFAMAHALLAGIYSNSGQRALAAPFARRAFELRDRVSERERFLFRGATTVTPRRVERSSTLPDRGRPPIPENRLRSIASVRVDVARADPRSRRPAARGDAPRSQVLRSVRQYRHILWG